MTHWNAAAAVATRPIVTWKGLAWRGHNRKWAATDPGGSRKFTGRYNRAPDFFPPPAITWAALYLGLDYGVCIGEITRHVGIITNLNNYRFTELSVTLEAVLDCRELAALGVTEDQLFHDTDYTYGHELAFAAIARNCEGILVPSATRLPDECLVVFPDYLHPGSQIAPTGNYVDPHLHIPNSAPSPASPTP